MNEKGSTNGRVLPFVITICTHESVRKSGNRKKQRHKKETEICSDHVYVRRISVEIAVSWIGIFNGQVNLFDSIYRDMVYCLR